MQYLYSLAYCNIAFHYYHFSKIKLGIVMIALLMKGYGSSKMEIKNLFFNKLATHLTIKTITKGKKTTL